VEEMVVEITPLERGLHQLRVSENLFDRVDILTGQRLGSWPALAGRDFQRDRSILVRFGGREWSDLARAGTWI
jgi:hypothetical protein